MSEVKTMNGEDLNQDLMTGAKEIGDFMNCNTRRAFYLLEKGLIAGFKTGKIWQARKSTLRTQVAEREAAAMAEKVA